MPGTAHLRLEPLITVAVVVVAFLSLVPFHELGHGIVGVFCGGTPSYLQVFGVQLWPRLAWGGIDEGLAAVDFTDRPKSSCYHAMALAGSGGTLVVAAGAVGLLWFRSWRGWRKALLVALSLWSLDLLTFTLPSVGIRRGILFGTRYSEPYEAATGLGIPGHLFQTVVFGFSFLVLALTLIRLAQRNSPV